MFVSFQHLFSDQNNHKVEYSLGCELGMFLLKSQFIHYFYLFVRDFVVCLQVSKSLKMRSLTK